MNRNKNEKGHPKLTVFNYFLIPVPRLFESFSHSRDTWLRELGVIALAKKFKNLKRFISKFHCLFKTMRAEF